MLESRPGDLVAGAVVGDVLVEALHRRGGHAAIYRAASLLDGRAVALKVLDPALSHSAQALRRFAQETAILARLRHAHLAQVLGSGDLTDGRPWLAMEWIDGPTLVELVRARGRLELAEALAVLEQLGGALAAAHDAGVFHRDVTLGNVLVAPGPSLDLRLIDFGVAKLLDDDDGRGGGGAGLTGSTVLGTPGAMAPEQILRNGVDARTDVYGLGVLMHHLLTGHAPFPATDRLELEELHLTVPAPPVSHHRAVPAGVDLALAKALAKRPADRHADVPTFVAAFRRALSESLGPGWVGLRIGLLAAGATATAALGAAMSAARAALAQAELEPVLAGRQLLIARRRLSLAGERQERAAIVEAAAALLAELGAKAPALAASLVVHAGDDVLGPGGWPGGVPGQVVLSRAAARELPLPHGAIVV
jgi:serine/threonine-protein kinase